MKNLLKETKEVTVKIPDFLPLNFLKVGHCADEVMVYWRDVMKKPRKCHNKSMGSN